MAHAPPSNAAQFNFTADDPFGVHVFTCPERALAPKARWVHFPSAKPGQQNSQLVSNVILAHGCTRSKRMFPSLWCMATPEHSSHLDIWEIFEAKTP